ncbi:hypothetical protein CAOG_01177 [Capsaspora owczarzaki ATCC 30864]|nr:hypothetical protein CAOG_01177 [Capsaspora owczarzaki ATCC 30864]|eukprot:XP_004366048.2 hypothetical protein CAOG_01177 [Capsaspora owczarzaki ATCC 30864]
MLRSGVSIPSLAACVEELVLNSIDAGATAVDVHVDLQLCRLRVLDNGAGIALRDLARVGERHATSKFAAGSVSSAAGGVVAIEDDADLMQTLSYYGFRGEALASVADMSTLVEIVTRVDNDNAGQSSETYFKLLRPTPSENRNPATQRSSEHEKPLPQYHVGVSAVKRVTAGTIVTVHGLFATMPVRQGVMLANPVLTLEHARRAVEAIALANPGVALSVHDDHNARRVLTTRRLTSALSVFKLLFGVERVGVTENVDMSLSCEFSNLTTRSALNQPQAAVSETLAAAAPESSILVRSVTVVDYSLRGFLCTEPQPGAKSMQFFFINRRRVLHTRFHKLVNQLMRQWQGTRGPRFVSQTLPVGRDMHASNNSRSFDKASCAWVLNMTCPPGLYDITFDPAKTLVEFADWETPLALVEQAIRTALQFHPSTVAVATDLLAATLSEPPTFASFQPGGLVSSEVVRRARARESANSAVEVDECDAVPKRPRLATEDSAADESQSRSRYFQTRTAPQVDRPVPSSTLQDDDDEDDSDIIAEVTALTGVDRHPPVRAPTLYSSGSLLAAATSVDWNEAELNQIRDFDFACQIRHRQSESMTPVSSVMSLTDASSLADSTVVQGVGPLGGGGSWLTPAERSRQHRQDLVLRNAIELPSIAPIPLSAQQEQRRQERFDRAAPPSYPTASQRQRADHHAENPVVSIAPVLHQFMYNRNATAGGATHDLARLNTSAQSPAAAALDHAHSGCDHAFPNDDEDDFHVRPASASSLQPVEDLGVPASFVTRPVPDVLEPDANPTSPKQQESDEVMFTISSKLRSHNNLERPADDPTAHDDEFSSAEADDALLAAMALPNSNPVLSVASSGPSFRSLMARWQNPVFPSRQARPMDARAASNEALRTQRKDASRSMHFRKELFGQLSVLSQVERQFVVVLAPGDDQPSALSDDGNDLIFCVDQHAAHERIRLERFTREVYQSNDQGTGSSQVLKSETLKDPLRLAMTVAEARLLEPFRDNLEACGIRFRIGSNVNALEDNAECAVMIDAVPPIMLEASRAEYISGQHVSRFQLEKQARALVGGADDVAQTVSSLTQAAILHGLISTLVRSRIDQQCHTGGGAYDLPLTISSALASKACHGAIKFGDTLSIDQCKSLVNTLSDCTLPFQCAHGRPSIAPLVSVRDTTLTFPELISAPDDAYGRSSSRPVNFQALRHRIAGGTHDSWWATDGNAL